MKKIYLATPYSGMEEEAYRNITSIAASLTLEGNLNPFSPITHSHPIHKINSNIPSDWKFWENIDKQFIDWADEVWIFATTLISLFNSKGVAAEYKYAKETNTPVVIYLGLDIENPNEFIDYTEVSGGAMKFIHQKLIL